MSFMLSQEPLDAYRKMTSGERLQLAFELTRRALPDLLEGLRVVDRRFELIRRDLKN